MARTPGGTPKQRKVRRQHPIDRFIAVDFACIEAKLIVKWTERRIPQRRRSPRNTARTEILESAPASPCSASGNAVNIHDQRRAACARRSWRPSRRRDTV
ncbi:DUF559 domain-containing protein [Methylobacterium oryzae CBMB20]